MLIYNYHKIIYLMNIIINKIYVYIIYTINIIIHYFFLTLE